MKRKSISSDLGLFQQWSVAHKIADDKCYGTHLMIKQWRLTVGKIHS